MTQTEAFDELLRLFLDATDDLPDDAENGIAAMLRAPQVFMDAVGATQLGGSRLVWRLPA